MRTRTPIPRRAVIALVAAASLGAAAQPTPPPAPEPQRNIAGPGDYDLRERLVRLLARDPALARERFTLILVNGGAVFSGEVSTCAAKMRLLRAAATTRGVINVTDEMSVARADLDDGALRKSLASALEESREALGLKSLKVRVEDAAATLEGPARDFEARVQAEQIAGSIAGIVRVNNRLAPEDAPSGADDRSLAKAVAAYLGIERFFPYPAKINVRAHDGVVTLSGVTSLCLARQQAGAMASLVGGVARVENSIKVDPSLERMRPVIQDLM
jgi:osmotically-inducible protein OsmY